MRSPLALLALLLVTTTATAACTAEPVPGADGPTGPCAASREQPPADSGEQRLQGDLDGDGVTDEVVSWERGGERVVQAWLATGENAEPQALFAGDLLEATDVTGDGRAEVRAELTPGGEPVLLALDGCALVPVDAEAADPAPSPGS